MKKKRGIDLEIDLSLDTFEDMLHRADNSFYRFLSRVTDRRHLNRGVSYSARSPECQVFQIDQSSGLLHQVNDPEINSLLRIIQSR